MSLVCFAFVRLTIPVRSALRWASRNPLHVRMSVISTCLENRNNYSSPPRPFIYLCPSKCLNVTDDLLSYALLFFARSFDRQCVRKEVPTSIQTIAHICIVIVCEQFTSSRKSKIISQFRHIVFLLLSRMNSSLMKGRRARGGEREKATNSTRHDMIKISFFLVFVTR